MNASASSADDSALSSGGTDSQALRHWLERYLRQKRRFLRGMSLSAGIALAAALVLTACAADVLFSLPPVARWLLLAGTAALFLTWCIRGLREARRLRRRVAMDEIEAMLPSGGQLVRTALEEPDSAASENPLRAVLRQALARDARQIAVRFRPERNIPWRNLKQRWIAAGATVAALLALMVCWPDFYTALRRLQNPAAGVSFTQVAFHKTPEAFMAGEEAFVTVKTRGREAERPVLSIRREGGAVEEISMVPQGAGLYTASLGKPEAPVTLTASAGDGVTESLTIPVLFPPKLQSLAVSLTFPDYTGLPPAEQKLPDIEAVEGTLAAVTIIADRPLEKGRVVFSDNTNAALEIAGNTLRFQAPVSRGRGKWHVEAEDDRGLKLAAAGGKWNGLEDKPPRVEWVTPKDDIEATPLAEVTLRVKAKDDFGLAQTGVMILAGGRERVLKTEDYNDGVPVSAVAEAIAALERENLGIRDNVKVFAFARDRFPAPEGKERRGVSDLRNIDIRQFKVWRAMREGGGGPPPAAQEALMKLETLIKNQRGVVNTVFRMREENAAAAEACRAASEKETTLSQEAQKLKGAMQTAGVPRDDLLLLDTAARQMAAAATSLAAPDVPASWTHADGALTSLLEVRREFMKIMVKNGTPCECESKPDDFKLPSLTELAKEAERLAGEEREVAKGVPAAAESAAENDKLAARQASAVADAGEFFDTLVSHPEATDLARGRMEEAEKSMSAAGRELGRRQAREALPPLESAADSLGHLAEHLRGLETRRAAETLKLASNMAKKAASACESKGSGKSGSGQGSGKGSSEAEEGEKPENQKDGERDGESGETGSGKEGSLAESARDAATIDDWLKRLSESESLGRAAERLGALREELKLPGAAERLAEVAAKAGSGEAGEHAGLAGEMRKLANALQAEHGRMVEGALEKLAEAREDAKSLSGKEGEGSAKGQEPGQGEGPGAGAGFAKAAAAFADRLKDINDDALSELSEELVQELTTGRATTPALAALSLEKIEARLEGLIQEIIQRQLLAGKSDRVPPAYEGLVANYFRRLSEDTGEEEMEEESEPEEMEQPSPLLERPKVRLLLPDPFEVPVR